MISRFKKRLKKEEDLGQSLKQHLHKKAFLLLREKLADFGKFPTLTASSFYAALEDPPNFINHFFSSRREKQ